MITIPGTVQGMLFVFWHGFKQWSGDTIEALNMVWIALLHAPGCTLVKASRRINYAKLPNWLCVYVEELSEYLLVSFYK